VEFPPSFANFSAPSIIACIACVIALLTLVFKITAQEKIWRMISMHTKQEIIIRRFRDGESISKIALETGVCRLTVRKYVESYEKEKEKIQCKKNHDDREIIEEIIKIPQYDTSNRKNRKINEEIISIVLNCLDENRKKRSRGQHKQLMKKVDILAVVRESGHDIGYTAICDLINKLESKHAETYIRQQYLPGDVCEFDWGEAKIFISGKLRIIPMAVFTSAYGNYRYSVLFPRANTQAFQEAHALFFSHIGGVFRNLVYDNMKVAVRKFVGRTEKEATLGLLQLSTYYNFGFRFCNVNAGNEKGHVEKSVSFVRQKAFSSKDMFSSLEEANEHLQKVCEALNKRPQSSNKNQTANRFLETEKDYLLPCETVPFEAATLADLRVDKYSTIMVGRNHYSVPEIFTGKIITAKIYPSEILCYHESEKICSHKKSLDRDEWIIDIDHYLTTLSRKPGAVAGSVAFQRMKQEYQTLFKRHFSDNPKDFIELLIYQKEKQMSLQDVLELVCKLEHACPNSITTDKIKTINERQAEPIKAKFANILDNVAAKQLLELSELIPDRCGLKDNRGVL
jgi:transposase